MNNEELRMKSEEFGMPAAPASIVLNEKERSDSPRFFTFHFSLFTFSEGEL